jgi:argininosuccinate lyase
LKKPDELIKEEHAEKLTIEALSSKQERTLKNLQTITEEQHKKITDEIETLKQDLENRLRCSDRYAEVKGNIEQAIKSKSKKPKKKASK